ncbi:hypothetical protein BFJ69_g17178 [Fusarium oxysporum]|uniref:WD-like domain-containing protein n=1 Tax=Fusarium oxysporum TaxID=5507 RepID=A0A420M904_FUSOX|nr:hypothetical protein BFJ69_g17178 [Fusarium oxysporum]
MYISAVLTLFALGFYHAAAASASELEAIEPLFLEFSIQEVLTNTSWIPVVEPWASQYVSAVRDGRYGDAVWARYHIAGDVHDGIVGGTTNMTVLQSIEEDALGYKLNDPEDYAKAQALYAQTSDHDGHKDIIQTLSHIHNQDISHLEARVRYSTSCSRNFIALRSDCVQLLRHMSTREVAIGDEQGVASWGTCRLRVSRYRGSSTDLTYYRAHAVGLLLEEHCAYVPPCCREVHVSGYSPRNSGHRKVCLSSKNSGCS